MNSVSLLALRAALGGFYVLARFRYFYDPSRPADPVLNKQRRESMARKMGYCHYPAWLAPIVAGSEVLAGLGVISGVLFTLSCAGLLLITIFATRCTWREKILEQSPCDCIDWLACYLWRVEGLYILLAAVLLVEGAGSYAL